MNVMKTDWSQMDRDTMRKILDRLEPAHDGGFPKAEFDE